MKRTLRILGLVSGDDMKTIVSILPETIGYFIQRKTYNEYYIKEYDHLFTIEELDKLSKEFDIRMDCEFITIDVL